MKECLQARLKQKSLSRAASRMKIMSEDRTYNGWTNYETWAVALWIDNERGNYDYWREEAREHRKAAPTCSQVINGIWTAEQAAKFNLADQLKEEIRDNAPDTEASMYTDLLRGALDEVNWNEIAGNWLSDLEDIEEEEEPEEHEEDAFITVSTDGSGSTSAKI